GGICTRQLPAAVCALFIPNQQNLAGLKKVVDDIRNEAKGDRKKTIQLHFVMSNVPDIDDEDRILEQWTDKFKDALGYKELAGTIHHYNSLDLLNQVIFSVDRQRSRLAKEYRTLLKALIRHNPEDRDGVLDFLRDVNRKAELDTGRIGISANELEDKLEKIRSLHAKDGDILYSLSTIKQRLGVINEALVLLSEAIDSGYRKSSAFMKRAELNSIIGNKEAARTDILEALNSSDNNYFTVSSAIMKLKELDPKALAKITSSSALTALDEGDVYQLANELSWSREELAIAEQLNQRLLQGAEKFQDSPFKEFAEINLSLCLIGLGRYKEAMELLGPNRESLESAGIISTFNYAMAEWAETEKPPRDLFELVIKLEAKGPLGESPNHQQCIAIAYWVTGGIEESKKYLERARQLMKARPRSEFSGWRYLRVEPDEFLEDLTSLEEMLDRKELRSPLKIKKSPRKKK
ncbi:MAG TPA: hypothetical protein VFQ43_02715, partial [Nitrososphaera sp.]|nr:hypothetical protein [Nitrososphaera sp.]